MCPTTCGKAVRTRKRTCTNPEPKNNGRLCIGSDREEESCPEITCAGQTARLSAWTGKFLSLSLSNRSPRSNGFHSDWDSCSKSCGSGIQKRRRTCLSSQSQCDECLEETRLCNESPCPGNSHLLLLLTHRCVSCSGTSDIVE